MLLVVGRFVYIGYCNVGGVLRLLVVVFSLSLGCCVGLCV